jgi:hypothetical protein
LRSLEVFSEAARNVSLGVARTVIAIVLATAAATGIASSDAVAVHAMLSEAKAYRVGGGSVQVVEAPGGIDATACDSLRRLPGVRASGALGPKQSIYLSAMPGQKIDSYSISAGFGEFDSIPGLRAAKGPALSRDLADVLGAGPGDTVATDEGPLNVASKYRWDNDGRVVSLGYAVLLPAAANAVFDECWADFADRGMARQLLSATIDPAYSGAQSDSAKYFQLNPSLGASPPTPQDFDRRPTRVAPAAGFVVGLFTFGALYWTRRVEFASARHAGLSILAQFSISILELCHVWFGTAAATLLIGIVAAKLIDPALMLPLLRVSLSIYAGSVVGVLVILLSSPERALFKLFKDR